MPVTRFFSMLKAGRRIAGMDLAKKCDIAFIPHANIEYYKAIKESCIAQAQGERLDEELEKARARLTPKEAPNVFEAGSQEAKYAVMSIFAAKKRTGH